MPTKNSLAVPNERIFIDTNILLYAVDRSDPKRRDKARLVLRGLIENGQPVVSTQVIQEFYVIATKKLRIEALLARRVVEQFRNFEVITIDFALINEAIDCSILNQISLWDALIVCAARNGGCKLLYSEDLNNSQLIGGVRVVNPFVA